ncbi:putative membrane protein [Leptolyngbyaceae cyanobacterium JSC-12]|nr:putative membrane protein [Leptolyngbyaceae cyanobacterium JSC-12]
MGSLGDRFNRLSGKTRFVVARLFIHLTGKEVAPLLGVLNQAARDAVDSDGDIQTLGEGLAEICQALLQYDIYWQSAANEGEVFWDEGEAGDFVEELFTDSAQRYRSGTILSGDDDEEFDTIPITQNLIVMITVAYEGEVPQLETDLASLTALKAGLKALINLHYQEKLRAIQVHFSPAQLGEELSSDQLMLNFPELVPL